MNSIEAAAAVYTQRLWLSLLSFTIATLFVLALRKLVRQQFGAERAAQLWWVPPVATLASQMPHFFIRLRCCRP